MEQSFIVLDIETTGLCVPRKPYPPQIIEVKESDKPNLSSEQIQTDEILQLAIVDQDGTTLFYDSFLPVIKKKWPAAQAIHRIAPKDLVLKKPFLARLEEIQSIINKAPLLVAYNTSFDLQFLEGQGVSLSGKPYICIMKAFAHALYQQKGYYRNSKWQSLATCAAFFNLVNENAHNALADAQLTRACFKAMINDRRFNIQPQIWSADT